MIELKDLKVGDEVMLFGSFGEPRKTKITKITPTGMIRIEASSSMFKQDGWERTRYSSARIVTVDGAHMREYNAKKRHQAWEKAQRDRIIQLNQVLLSYLQKSPDIIDELVGKIEDLIRI